MHQGLPLQSRQKPAHKVGIELRLAHLDRDVLKLQREVVRRAALGMACEQIVRDETDHVVRPVRTNKVAREREGNKQDRGGRRNSCVAEKGKCREVGAGLVKRSNRPKQILSLVLGAVFRGLYSTTVSLSSQMPRPPSPSIPEREFLYASLKQSLRLDGRLPLEMRETTLTFGPDLGWVDCTMGRTRYVNYLSLRLGRLNYSQRSCSGRWKNGEANARATARRHYHYQLRDFAHGLD